jgi:serine/threonine-protein kinase
MSLAAGVRLGSYEIIELLGAGGMGEVYKARDTRLDRTVAIKILPSQLASDPQFRERFDREARSISQLNHPHICTLHDVGEHQGTAYLVMELLDGQTLARRLERGALAMTEALTIAIQVADALDAAHRAGIIHRDLKPGNIVLTKGGAKLLDFGLAKTTAPAVTAGHSMLPTTPQNLTAQGTILGTFQYMAPEQIEGQEADARTDVFAFGCVLYEMVTGRKAFQGKTQASLLGAILKDEPPPIRQVQPLAPAPLDHVITRCLAKDPDQRWQSAADLAHELKWVAISSSDAGSARLDVGNRRRERLLWGIAVVVASVASGTAGWMFTRGNSSRPAAITRAVVPLASVQTLTLTAFPSIALSPDGRTLVYSRSVGGTSQLHVRAMDELQPRPIPGTEGGLNPFFSPDSQSLGFLSGRSIKTVAFGGGAPLTVFDGVTNLRGADWGDDGWIYFTPHFSQGLWRVPASGGKPEVLTTPDFAAGEKTHRWPCVLPGGKAVLLVVGTSRTTTFDDARIEVLDLGTRIRRTLVQNGTYPRYLPTGHLLYARAGTLVAVAFDARRLELRGSPVTVQDNVSADPAYGFANFGVSGDGSLLYVPGSNGGATRTFVMADRHGTTTPRGDPGSYSLGRVSPDGTRVATYMVGATSQIAIADLTRGGSWSRLTYEWDNENPIWTPDGAHLTFNSNRGGGLPNLYSQSADGGGEAERLTTSDHVQRAGSWTPDGKTLAFVDIDPASLTDIWVLRLDDRKPRPLIKTPFEDDWPAISPDGRWIAYMSNQSGQYEVYVQAFPSGGRRWQVSTGGGVLPFWNPKGGELIYQSAPAAGVRHMWAVAVTTSPEFRPGTPERLFETTDRLFDIMPDGRFVMLRSNPPAAVTELEVVFNWFEEVRRKAAPKP